MKHFRLNFVLCIVAIILFSVISTMAFCSGHIAVGILSGLLLAISATALYRTVRTLINNISVFVDAMEMGDSTMRLTITDHPLISRMFTTLQRMVEVYNSAKLQLETRKLYYDRILRIMTHEMRNAITPIVSLSSDMKSNPSRYQGDNLTEAVELINEESVGICRFLESYYELTHLPKPQIETINVKDLFDTIRKSFVVRLEKYGFPADTISYTIPVDMTIRGDASLLSRALTNLLNNSMQAVLTVEQPIIKVIVSLSEGKPYICIEDNGGGIPDEIMQNLFQPFYTTKPGGSGIGLCLSRQIARLHGGDLMLTSSRRGTAAHLTLAKE